MVIETKVLTTSKQMLINLSNLVLMGFSRGRKPYLTIHSTFLTGKFKGQLATTCAVDGHNWIYPVAFGIMYSKMTENWIWFMEMSRDALRIPEGLTFCIDARQAIKIVVGQVFPNIEDRECMIHLVNNFKKMYHGKIFNDHLWLVSYSWHPYMFDKH
jgi:hypothetical protein